MFGNGTEHKQTISDMKKKISISIEDKTLKIIEEMVRNPDFRNKSHVVELDVNKFAEGKNDN